ncbi:hypothetical protein HYFRA_00005271 [Hymenoscyphus fraxineus]|uniref:NADP-dependent oxidoreductase domain-containing protein n=1 Tax=Hymenoscyphus fraxineus TaxID=746836 RepID=A0A9N9LD03_9HELO|nr:hypothetical protein HYFRA_00005271 [Hymenoscyphus fraxineus]
MQKLASLSKLQHTVSKSSIQRMTSNSTTALRSTLSLPNAKNAKEIPRIHLGVYMTSGRTCSTAVTHALNAGYRAFDSAEWYGNEKAVGSAILAFLNSPENQRKGEEKVKREDIWFTTKLKENKSEEETRRKIEKSIQECGLGYIDLYLLHSPYAYGKTDPKETRKNCWKAVETAIKEGSVKVGGVSNFGVKHLKELLDDEEIKIKPAINQIEVHPFNTQPEITSFCKENGIVVEAYAPLARAMRARHPQILELAGKYSCTWAQLMIKWSLQHGYVTLPKSVKQERIVKNKEVDGFTIHEEDMRILDGLDERLVTDWDPTDAP